MYFTQMTFKNEKNLARSFLPEHLIGVVCNRFVAWSLVRAPAFDIMWSMLLFVLSPILIIVVAIYLTMVCTSYSTADRSSRQLWDNHESTYHDRRFTLQCVQTSSPPLTPKAFLTFSLPKMMNYAAGPLARVRAPNLP